MGAYHLFALISQPLGLFSCKIFFSNELFFSLTILFSISGNPVLFDWEGAKFQGVIIETKDGDDKKRDFALAVVLKDINVDTIIEKVLKKKPGKLGWMAKATSCKFGKKAG